MTTDVQDVEITLAAHDLILRVSPYGAALRGLWREQQDGTRFAIATGYSGAEAKVGAQGDVLIPFPGRIREGSYTFNGQTYQMEKNDREGPNAIHGFLRHVPWQTVDQSPRDVTFSVEMGPEDYPGYPFALRVTLTYALDEGGLTTRLAIENIGAGPAPVAAGFHPYFTVGSELIDTDTLQIDMASVLDFVDMLPTGKVLPVEGTPFDFREPRLIGTMELNHCYLNPIRDADGLARIHLTAPPTGRNVTVWMDAAFNYVVIFSGESLPEPHRRRSLAIEPMTCGSDAFNHHEWGLVTLAPGETFTGAWGVSGE
jgi:aldose 1-epimerase